jgi:phosphatidylserine decarboxylase
MKHSGKAAWASLKMVIWPLAVMVVALVATLRVSETSPVFPIAFSLAVLAALVVLFILYFFRDPEARVPDAPKIVLSPGHGKVDVIDETDELAFMGGRCKRISMFLSVVDVHVQNVPVSGTVKYLKHTPGKFLNAMGADCAAVNENVLIGFESSECAGQKIGARLIAGLIARRIIPWVVDGETVTRGERMSLIQFGSRVDVYLPLNATIKVALGDRVVGGESILAILG